MTYQKAAPTERAIIRRINSRLFRSGEGASLRTLRRNTRAEREFGRYVLASGSRASLYIHKGFRSVADLAKHYSGVVHKNEIEALYVAAMDDAASVARVFIGPCPAGMRVGFIDGDKANCALYNLRHEPMTAA